MYELVLVSQSPRRRELLEKAGFLFRVDTVKISEIIEKNVNPEEGVRRLAADKARAYLSSHKHLKGLKKIVLSADTLVFLGNQALGKPENSDDAKRILGLLSGKTHRVITGVCFVDTSTGEELTDSVITEVEFRKLSESEIAEYVKTGEPLDKAGAYGIQGLGGKFVASTRGSYSNVVGLPVERVLEIIAKRGWEIARR